MVFYGSMMNLSREDLDPRCTILLFFKSHIPPPGSCSVSGSMTAGVAIMLAEVISRLERIDRLYALRPDRHVSLPIVELLSHEIFLLR